MNRRQVHRRIHTAGWNGGKITVANSTGTVATYHQINQRTVSIHCNTFSKNYNKIHMDSDGDKIYTKIIDLDEIYNFVIQTFFI